MSKRCFKISWFESIHSNKAKDKSVSWDAIIKVLRKDRSIDEKDQVATFSAATFADGKRSGATALELSLLILDVDNKQVESGHQPVSLAQFAERLREAGVASALATTWSNTLERPKFRVIIPLEAPIPAGEWQQWVPHAIEALNLGNLVEGVDRSCLNNVAGIYFLPSHPPEGATEVVITEGKLLSVPLPQHVLEGARTGRPLPTPPDAASAQVNDSTANLPAPTLEHRLLARCEGDLTTLDVVGWFKAHGFYIGPNRASGGHRVRCPWHLEHSNPDDDHATCIWEGAPGQRWARFNCLHAHCEGRRIEDVIARWGDADLYCQARFTPGRKDPSRIVLARGPLPSVSSNGNRFPYVPDPHAETRDGFPATEHELLSRYVYVSGLDRVLDRKTMTFITAADLNKTLSGHWLRDSHGDMKPANFFGNAKRVRCTKDQVVFAPGTTVSFPMINLFTGFPHDGEPMLSPEEIVRGTQHFLKVLRYLCGDSFEFVLNWLGYPIRFPGAKMRSALLVYGPQGIGKNLIFEVAMRLVYGRWSRLITQRDLESSFNSWMSRQLYVVADEVLATKGKRDTSALLKGMITSETVSINEKGIPQREEANHTNFVFLSNENRPLHLDADDRRHHVVRVPGTPLPPEDYKALAAELRATNGRALYQMLKTHPVQEDFINLPVPMTVAKASLKESCASSIECFFREWRCVDPMTGRPDLAAAMRGENELGLPYGPAGTSDAYTAYCHWCYAENVRPAPKKAFYSEGFGQFGWVRKKSDSVRYYVPPDFDLAGESASEWLRRFKAAVQKLRVRNVFEDGGEE